MEPPSSRASEDHSVEAEVRALRSLHDGLRHLPTIVSFGEHAVPALEALLRGPTESVDQPRSLAADALGLIRGPVATRALVRALRDSTTRRLDPVLEQAEYVVANRIAENLDHSSDADAVDALLDALRTYPYPGCVKALARTRERRAIPLLAERLGDDVTRDAAVEGLRRFDPDLTQRVLVQTVADRRLENGVERSDRVWGRAAAVLLLGELGAPDVELARALDDPQVEVREAAARALSVRGAVDTRAIDVLVDALGGEDWMRAETAREALAVVAEAAVPRVLEAVARRGEDITLRRIRRRAMEFLGRAGDPRAIWVLGELATDPDVATRRAAVWALGRIGTSESVEALIRYIHDPDAEVRRGVVDALATTRASSAWSSLAEMLNDRERSIRSAARVALEQGGVPALASLRAQKSWRARWIARRLLRSMRSA